MAYPLPDSPAFEAALRYYLVAVPDRPEYRRAALGAYSDFTKYWLWGLEKTSDESHEAAASWELAVAETLRLLEMNWPDQVIDHIDELETLLRQIAQNDIGDPPCCGNLDPEDEIVGPPPFDPGVGTPPANYGDWSVADWDEYYDRLCANAHSYVLLLVLNTRKLAALVAAGTAAITLVASILGILSGAGILLKIAYTTAAALVGGLVNVSASALLNEAADDIEVAAEEIVCAIVHNYPSLASVVESIVSPASWSLFFQWINWENAANVLLNGGTGSTSLPDRSLPGECTFCDDPNTFSYAFNTTNEGWERRQATNGPADSVDLWTIQGNPPGAITNRSGWNQLDSPGFELLTARQVRFSYDRYRVTAGGNTFRHYIFPAGSTTASFAESYNSGGGGSWKSTGPTGWITLPAGTYYVKLFPDSIHYIDNVVIEVRDIP